MRQQLAGAGVAVGDGGLGAADRGRRFAGGGERGQVDGDQRGGGRQGSGAAVPALCGKPAPVAVVGPCV